MTSVAVAHKITTEDVKAPADMSHQTGDSAARYYCRGCGEPLLGGETRQFHPDCLKADKRRRTREGRLREQTKFQTWLRRLKCPQCGRKFGKPG